MNDLMGSIYIQSSLSSSISDHYHELRQSFTRIVESGSENLASLGFTSEAARFECLQILRHHADDLISQCNAGAARHEFYREYVISDGDSYRVLKEV